MSAPLLTQIYRHGVRPYSDSSTSTQATEIFLSAIPKAVPFVADNVARWFHDIRDRHFDVEKDTRALVPPFEYTWIEYADYYPEDIKRIGVLYMTSDYGTDDDATGKVNTTLKSMVSDSQSVKEFPTDNNFEAVHPARWLIYALPIAWGSRHAVGPFKTWIAALAPDGSMCQKVGGGLCNISLFDLETPPEAQKAFSMLLTESILTLGFLNCRNVSVEEHLPSRQERRSAQRRGEEIIKYRTLAIEPMRKVLQTEGRIAEVGLSRALHICRGHFSEYSEDKPLFGKYAGRFWIPAHVRGTTESGIVVKDYNVKAPRAV